MLLSLMLALSCCLDAFAASFAYGSKGIKIPLVSFLIINLICSFILGLSLWLGSAVRLFIPENLTPVICFIILFIMGIIKLLDSVTKSVIKKYNKKDGEGWKIEFSLMNLKFILSLYANPEDADVDLSKDISPAEAAALAMSLSLDGMAIGFGAAIGEINIIFVIIFSLITDMAALISGCYIGRILKSKLSFNITWLSGAILIVLAVLKLL